MIDHLTVLASERQRLRDAIDRCDDLGMKMLLVGKLKANHREAQGIETAIAAGSREGHDSEAWRGAKQARAAIAQTSPSNPNEDGL